MLPPRRLLTLALLLLATGCSLAEPPIRGVVVEEGSGRPLADATVYIMWSAQGSAAGLGSYSACVGIDFAQTDGEGRFELPGRGGTGYVQAYKPGYEWFYRVDKHGNVLLDPLSKPQTVSMRTFKGSVKERLEYLQKQLGKECGSRENHKKIAPYYRALYEEGKAIATKPDERKIVGSLLFSVEDLELDHKEVLNRLNSGYYNQ